MIHSIFKSLSGQTPRQAKGVVTTILAGFVVFTTLVAGATEPLLTFDLIPGSKGPFPATQFPGVEITLSDSVTAAADGPGGAPMLIFDGTDKSIASFKSSPELKSILTGDEVSVTLWVRADQFKEATIGMGFNLRRYGYMEQAPLGFSQPTKKTDFGSYNVSSDFSHPMYPGFWHHLAYTYSLSNLHYTVYYDGIEMANKRVENDEPSPISSVLRNLGKNFKGAIADLRVWDQALTKAQVLSFKPTQAEADAFAAQVATISADIRHAPLKSWAAELSAAARAAAKQGTNITDWQELQHRLRKLPRLAQFSNSLAAPSLMANAPLATFTMAPYDEQKRLPHILPHDGQGTDTITATLAQGEYEGVTFMVYPYKDIEKFEIKTTPLTQGDSVLPDESLDIRLIKVWYTPSSSWNSYYGGGRDFATLAPELLLYDDDLIRTDHENRYNYLRVSYPEGTRYIHINKRGTHLNTPAFNYVKEPVIDAKTLQPLPLTTGRNQQFWITVHMPSNAVPGTYSSQLTLIADGADIGKLTLKANVHPFVLPRPRTNYDIDREYYGTWMHHIMLDHHVALGKNRAQAEKRLLAELKNMAAHNFLHPHSPDVIDPELDEISIRHYEIMREAGMPLKPLWAGSFIDVGWYMRWMLTPGFTIDSDREGFERAMTNVWRHLSHKQKTLDKLVGHRDVYLKPWDEAGSRGDRFQFPFFSLAHQFGYKVFITSGNPQWTSFIVDHNDIPAHVNRTQAESWHAGGALQSSYAAPFTGPTNPFLRRRSNGIRMYLANYDGVNEYNWYEGYHIWNEFLSPAHYNNFNIVYPTYDGVLDTIPWEALREAFDDVRYASLLRLRARDALATDDTAKHDIAKQALLWIGSIDPETIDLDEMRATMVQWILKL